MRVFLLFDKNEENILYGQKQHTIIVFCEKNIFEKLHASHQSCKKQMFRNNILKFNSFIIYNQIRLNSIKNHINLHTFDKQCLNK